MKFTVFCATTLLGLVMVASARGDEGYTNATTFLQQAYRQTTREVAEDFKAKGAAILDRQKEVEKAFSDGIIDKSGYLKKQGKLLKDWADLDLAAANGLKEVERIVNRLPLEEVESRIQAFNKKARQKTQGFQKDLENTRSYLKAHADEIRRFRRAQKPLPVKYQRAIQRYLYKKHFLELYQKTSFPNLHVEEFKEQTIEAISAVKEEIAENAGFLRDMADYISIGMDYENVMVSLNEARERLEEFTAHMPRYPMMVNVLFGNDSNAGFHPTLVTNEDVDDVLRDILNGGE